jgi:DNA-binding NtrC family response regulator
MTPRRVLVVDDNHLVLRAMERLIGQLGHEIESASSVAIARQLIASGGFDIVLSAIRLRDGSGSDILRVLENQATPTRVILLADGSEPSFPTSKLLRVRYVQKGDDVRDLLDAVRDAAT